MEEGGESPNVDETAPTVPPAPEIEITEPKTDEVPQPTENINAVPVEEQGIKIEDVINPSGDVFTTMNEKLNLKVPQNTLEFLNKSAPVPRSTKPIIHLSKVTNSYTTDEIERATDIYLRSGKIQLQDPVFIASVIEEMIARYLQLIEQSEYKKAHDVKLKINQLKELFYNQDSTSFRQHHMEKLQNMKKEMEVCIKDTQKIWAGKVAEKKEEFKTQIYNLEDKQNLSRQNLENEWRQPNKQRKYNKQSKELIHSRAVEKYMVIAGELELAEKQKKKNIRIEKHETKKGYEVMSTEFEHARDRLEVELDKQKEDLKTQQTFELQKMKLNERAEIDLIKKRITYVDKLIKNEERIQKTKVIKHSRSKSSELPVLSRTAENISAKNELKMKTMDLTAKPLPLPPLTVKKRPKKGNSEAKKKENAI